MRHWVNSSRRAKFSINESASNIGSMHAIDGAPMLRSRPALIARRKSAPPRSAASAVVPEPMAAPIRNWLSVRKRATGQLMPVNIASIYIGRFTG